MNPKIGINELRKSLEDLGYTMVFQMQRHSYGIPLRHPLKDKKTYCTGIITCVAVPEKGKYVIDRAYCSSDDIFDKNYGRLTAARRVFRQIIGRNEQKEHICPLKYPGIMVDPPVKEALRVREQNQVQD